MSSQTWRYWRVHITDENGGGGIQVEEIEFRLNGVDVTGSGTPSASSIFGGFPASNAFDNNTGTSWASDFSNSWPQWIKYDFGAGQDKKITSVYWDPTIDNARSPRDFKIQCSLNNTDWVDAYTQTGLTWSGTPKEWTFTPPSHGGRRQITIVG